MESSRAAAGLCPGSSAAGLRALVVQSDPTAVAAMPPPPPRPTAKTNKAGRGGKAPTTAARGAKASLAGFGRGGKAAAGGKASSGRGGKAVASGKPLAGSGRGGKAMAGGAPLPPPALHGEEGRRQASPPTSNAGEAAEDLGVDGTSPSTQHSVQAHVAAHLEFQAVLQSQGGSTSDDLNLLYDLSQCNDGFTGMMNDAIGLEDFTTPMVQQEDDIDNEDSDDVAEVPKGKWARGGNYSVQEDEALVSAWQNVTTDPVAGKDQPRASYWQRISDYFHDNVKVETFRSIGSLSHRWKSIQECCTRWSGCVENVDRQQPSGLTIEDRQNLTQELYKTREPQGRGFAMPHCWQMLKNNEKWINRDKEPQYPLKKRGSSELDLEDYDDDESGRSTTPSLDWPSNKRPPGRKVSKERLKRGEVGGDAVVFQSAVQDIIMSKKELEASRKEDKQAKMEAENKWREYIKTVEERKMAIGQERLRVQEEEAIARKEEAIAKKEEAIAKKIKQEMKIMFMDISGLDDQQKKWVLATRGDIARKAQMGASTSSNGNGDESV